LEWSEIKDFDKKRSEKLLEKLREIFVVKLELENASA